MDAQLLYVKKFNGVQPFDYKTQFVDGVWEFKGSGAFYCGKCRLIYPSEERANQCCQNYTCKCGKICERKYYLSCDECSKKQEIEREKEKFNKATKLDIKDYKGYLLLGEYASDDFSGYFDDYFENTCDFACPQCGDETEAKDCPDVEEHSHLHCKNPDCKWQSRSYEITEEIYYLFAPEYIWATDFEQFEIDIDRVLENALEDHHESVGDYYKGVKELKEAVDKFNLANVGVGSYNESNKLALINIKEYIKKMYGK